MLFMTYDLLETKKVVYFFLFQLQMIGQVFRKINDILKS